MINKPSNGHYDPSFPRPNIAQKHSVLNLPWWHPWSMANRHATALLHRGFSSDHAQHKNKMPVGHLIFMAGWYSATKSAILKQYLSQTNNLFKHHGHHSFKCFAVGFTVIRDFAIL